MSYETCTRSEMYTNMSLIILCGQEGGGGGDKVLQKEFAYVSFCREV